MLKSRDASATSFISFLGIALAVDDDNGVEGIGVTHVVVVVVDDDDVIEVVIVEVV
jgi:hypothetical protein